MLVAWIVVLLALPACAIQNGQIEGNASTTTTMANPTSPKFNVTTVYPGTKPTRKKFVYEEGMKLFGFFDDVRLVAIQNDQIGGNVSTKVLNVFPEETQQKFVYKEGEEHSGSTHTLKCDFAKCADIFPAYLSSAPIPIPFWPDFDDDDGKCGHTIHKENSFWIDLDYISGYVLHQQITQYGAICATGAYFCYATAFEGGTKMNGWDTLKLKNIEGNIVAEKCNQGDNYHNVMWHGFAIFRELEFDDGNFSITDGDSVKNFTRKWYPKETLIFSYSDKRIQFIKGEYIRNINYTDALFPAIETKTVFYYLSSDSYYSEEVIEERRVRNDLSNADLSTLQKVHHQLNFDAAFWATSIDMAYVDADKFAFAGYEPGNEKFRLMKVVIPEQQCYSYKKELMKKKQHMLNETYKVFLPDSFVSLEEKNLTQYKIISEELYNAGIMMPHLKCRFIDGLYLFAKFDPKFATNQVTEEMNWRHEFELFNGCKQVLVSLSEESKVPAVDRERKLGLDQDEEPPVHVVDFYVGIKQHENVQFELSPDYIKRFLFFMDPATAYFRNIKPKIYYGVQILKMDELFDAFKKYKLTAHFRAANSKMLEKIGFPANKIENSGFWKDISVNLGVYQEVYKCPKFDIYLPRVSGRMVGFLRDANDNLHAYNYGHDHNHELSGDEDPVSSYELVGAKGKCTVKGNHYECSDSDWKN